MDAKAGDIIVTESQTFLDAYVVCRVIKIGKVMWEVETMRKDFREGWFFEKPNRRKVRSYKIFKGNNIEALAEKINIMREDFWKSQREAEKRYHSNVNSLPGLEHP